MNAVPAPFVIQTPGRPTQDEISCIRAVAEAYRGRVLGALLRDLVNLPGDLLRGNPAHADRQAA
jgi:hypothetical protein